jgi:hypothetical protein
VLGTRPAAPPAEEPDDVAAAPLPLRDDVDEPLRDEPPVEAALLDELLVVGMIEAMPLAIDDARTQFDDEGVE